jgi:hypothetical protein
VTGEPMKRTPYATMLSILVCICLGNGRLCAVAEHASPEVPLVVAAFGSGDAASKSPRSRHADEGIELDWLLAQHMSPTASEENGATVIAIFRSLTPQGVEEEVAKAHKLEFVRRLDTSLTDGRVALYRITDGRAAAEVVAALNGDVRVSAAHENVRYSLPPQVPAPAAVSGAKPSPTQRHASRPDVKPNLSDRAPQTARRLGEARDRAVANSTAILGSGQRSGLVMSKQMALRFPTADEPFVNIGGRSK